jgi:hypothetical protein
MKRQKEWKNLARAAPGFTQRDAAIVTLCRQNRECRPPPRRPGSIHVQYDPLSSTIRSGMGSRGRGRCQRIALAFAVAIAPVLPRPGRFDCAARGVWINEVARGPGLTPMQKGYFVASRSTSYESDSF